ncbi:MULTISPECIES: hypothetical protein [Methylosinus]|nr:MULTISPECIES: hypothetical protein [Methylosinus]
MSHRCHLLKLIAAAAFYLIAMPSPAAAELAPPTSARAPQARLLPP